MSSDLSIDTEYNTYRDFILAPPLNYGDLDGRQITWRDLPQIRSEIESRIIEIYNSGNHVVAYQLATLYFQQIYPEYEVQLVKSPKKHGSNSGGSQAQYLREFQDRFIEEQKTVLAEFALVDPVPPLEPISETNYPVLWAYYVYCQENGIVLSLPKTPSSGLKEFWEEHKKAIIIAAVIIVVAVTVTVVIVTTAGTGTQVAVATGAAAAQSAIDSYNSSEDSDLQHLQHKFQVDQEVQIFAKTIGSTDMSNTNESIPIIKTNVISEFNPEILTGLVSLWNINLAPVLQSNGRPSPPHSFYPPIDPAVLYGVENVDRWYKQFGLEYTASPPDAVDPSIRNTTSQTPQETRPSSSSQEFVKFIESKLAEARDPHYKDQFSRPPYTQEFVEMIEDKLAEAQDPTYLEQFSKPAYNQQFIKSIENALAETQDQEKYKNELWETHHDFMTATQAIFAFLDRTKPAMPLDGSYSTYASTLASSKPPAPIADIPLLGYPNQSTIHYHCGIKNNYGSVVEGGLCLNNTLNNQFAVQPHLIHSNNILAGLSLVQVEKYDNYSQEIAASGLIHPNSLKSTDTNIPWPEAILQNSHIHQSIEYEVKNLSQIAQKIIETGNPNLKQVHVTFSNGGYVFREALKKLTPEERDTIIVVTTGTTAIIDDDLAHEVYNVIGNKDWPSISCNGGPKGIDNAKDVATIELIPQTETQTVIGGHYFVQPDYQQKVSEILRNELNQYEIY